MSGQCFRVTKESDESFTVVLKDRVINIKENNGILEYDSNNTNELEKLMIEYFDLDRDYESINKYLLNKDKSLKDVVDYSKGYKILNQDDFEMLISYIISQNNTVRNISNCIEKISKKFGKKVVFRNKEYYLFPTYEELKDVSESELKECSVGFRSKYIIEALKNTNILNEIYSLETDEALKQLMKIKGVGIKVASCILLFSYGRFDTFPIDTWVKKYFNLDNEAMIRELAFKKYGEYSGLVIQYMFHYSRNRNKLN